MREDDAAAGTWRDHADRPVRRPEPPGPGEDAFYAAIGDFQGGAYRRNAFTAGTDHEADVLWDRLGLEPGWRVLDVGCGNGRHLRALADRGVDGVGVDVSPGLVAAAERAGDHDTLRFVAHDARDLGGVVAPGSFDAAWSLCQGAVGTSPAGDPGVVAAMARALRPGGRLAVTLFHALFAVRHLAPGDAFDPRRLVHHQVSEVRAADDRRRFDLWTTAYTDRGARRLVTDAGLEVRTVVGCEPGRFDRTRLSLDDPELLVLARRPSDGPPPGGTEPARGGSVAGAGDADPASEVTA